MRPAGPIVTPGGLPVRSWLVHEGPARVLVHRLKYEGIGAVATLAAAALEPMIPPGTTSLVPLPRVVARRARYGVDPARELASALSRRTGIPVVDALAAPAWEPRRAGLKRSERSGTRFGLRRAVTAPLLVDDVVTTGRTLDSAVTALGGAKGALTVTGVP